MVAIGIDLGTVGARVALAQGGRVTQMDMGSGSLDMPAVVTFAGAKPQVGRPALARCVTNPNLTVRGIKRFLGKKAGTPDVARLTRRTSYGITSGEDGLVKLELGQEAFYPEEIAAVLLGRLRELVEMKTGEAVGMTVLTVPPAFDEAAQNALRRAASLASLKDAILVPEPVAAVSSIESPSVRRLIVVVDIGGAFTTVSTLLTGTGRVTQIVESSSDMTGGEDVDYSMVKAIAKDLGVPPNDPALLEMLRQACETMKRDLCVASTATAQLPPLPFLQSDGAIRVDKKMFRKALRSLLRTVNASCIRIRNAATGGPAVLGATFLIGGMSCIPDVQKAVNKALETRFKTNLSRTGATVVGAARLAAYYQANPGQRPSQPKDFERRSSAPPPSAQPAVTSQAPAPTAESSQTIGFGTTRKPTASPAPPSVDAEASQQVRAPIAPPADAESSQVRAPIAPPADAESSQVRAPIAPPADAEASQQVRAPITPPADAEASQQVKAPIAPPMSPPVQPGVQASPPPPVVDAEGSQQVTAPVAPPVDAEDSGQVQASPAPPPVGAEASGQMASPASPVQASPQAEPQRTSAAPQQAYQPQAAPPPPQQYQPPPTAQPAGAGVPQGGATMPWMSTGKGSSKAVAPLLSKGKFKNPMTAVELANMPLTRPLTEADMNPIMFPVLLARVGLGVRLSGTLTFKSEDKKPLVIPLDEGEAQITAGERTVLLQIFGWEGGTFTFDEKMETPTDKAGSVRMLPLVIEGLRTVMRNFSTDDMAVAMGERMKMAPFIPPRQLRYVGVLGLSPMESRLVRFGLDGKQSALEIVEHGGVGKRTTLGVMILMTVLDLLKWTEAEEKKELTIAEELDLRVRELKDQDMFEHLSVHWTAGTEDVEKAYQKLQKELGPGSYRSSVATEACRKILEKAKVAHDYLINERQRVAYRLKTHPDHDYDSIAEFLAQKAKAVSMHDDVRPLDGVKRQLDEIQKARKSMGGRKAKFKFPDK